MTSDTKHRETGEAPEVMRHLLRVRQYLGGKKVPRQNIVPHVLHAIEALSAYPDLVAQNAELKAALRLTRSLFNDDGEVVEQFQDQISVALETADAALSNSGATS